MESTDIVTVALIATAGLLLWKLLQRRLTGDTSEDDSDYSGSARDPNALVSVDKEALEEFDRLLMRYGADVDE
tara:strand:- start:212 stop:430 length:219 start_codon:yes stop_codon:yes gene_type:complete